MSPAYSLLNEVPNHGTLREWMISFGKHVQSEGIISSVRTKEGDEKVFLEARDDTR